MPKSPDSGFDIVAPFYDRLAKLVFGNVLQEAQLASLPVIPDGATVLIAGGGSGWILKQLLTKTRCRQILYLEASEKMLELTRKVLLQIPHPETKVELRPGTEKNLDPEAKFDIIITNFLLDLYTGPRLNLLISELEKRLLPGGLWLVTDFRFIAQKQIWWQKALLQSMYLFFRLTCRINAGKLADWDKALQQTNLNKTKSVLFYNDMIEAAVYRKSALQEI